MFRTAAIITALSIGLIVSGTALVGTATPAAATGMTPADEERVQHAPDPTDTRGGPIEKKARPAPELPDEEARMRYQGEGPVTGHLPDERASVN